MIYKFCKVGFHTGPNGDGANMTGIGDHFQALVKAGIPIVLKSVDNYGPIWEALSLNPHPASQFCYRISEHKTYDGVLWDPNVPRYDMTPTDAADYHMTRTMYFLPPEFNTYWVKLEIMNEVDKNRADWLGNFCTEVILWLINRGLNHKIRFLGFAPGEPEKEHWETPGMLRLLKAMSLGVSDGIALHEYSLDDSITSQEGDLIGRGQRYLFQVCDEQDISRPKLWITEWGWRQEWVPEASQAIPDIDYILHKHYADDPDVEAAGLWYLGPKYSDSDGVPVAQRAQKLILPLTSYAINYGIEEIEDMGTHKAVVVKVPQDITLEELHDVVELVHNFKHTFAYSHDDMFTIISGGNAESFVKFSHPERDEDAVTLVEMAGYQWEPLYPPPTTPLPGAPLDVLPLSQRNPLWADAVLGQNTGHGKTIGSWGCLLVAYNIMARYLGYSSRLPDAENTHFVSAGAFTSQFIKPGALSVAYPDKITYNGFKPRSDPAMRPMIREWLDKGIPVPARVDFNPATTDFDQHWVLLIGYIGETDFWMADPWYGDIQVLNSRYAILGSDVLEAVFYTPSGDPGGDTGVVSDVAFGIHASANPDFAPGEIDMCTVFQPEAFKLMGIHNPNDVSALQVAFPNALYITRAFISGSDQNGPRNISPSQFFNDTINDIERTLNIVGMDSVIELHNEPNLKAEGWTGGWQNATDFVNWLEDVVDLYRARLPNAKLIFPGLSPGAAADYRDDYLNYLDALIGHPVLDKLDGIGVHAYWSDAFGGYGTTDPHSSINVLTHYLQRFPNTPLYITEASNNAIAPDSQKAAEYLLFWEDLQTLPNIKCVCYYIASDVSGTYAHEAWLGTDIPVLVQDR